MNRVSGFLFGVIATSQLWAPSFAVAAPHVTNFSTLIATTLAVLVLLFRRRAPATSISALILVLFLTAWTLLNWILSAYNFSVQNGAATAIRYMLYLSVAALALNYQGSHRIEFARGLVLAYVLTVMASVLLGILFDREVFLNGQYRLYGLSASPVGLALASSVAMLGLLLTFVYERPASRYRVLLMVTYFSICFYGLVLTGSRQPMLGVVFVLTFVIFFKSKLLAAFLLICAIGFSAASYEFVAEISPRIAYLVESLLSSRSLEALSTIKEGSLQARFSYITFGAAQVSEEAPFFGFGLNAFPALFENNHGIRGVAPHFDPLQFYVDGGLFGLTIYLSLIGYGIVASALKRDNARLLIIAYYILCTSLNNVLYYHSITVLLLFLYFHKHRQPEINFSREISFK